MASGLKQLGQLVNEHFTRKGIRVFDIPVKQLFQHDDNGELVVHEDADMNRAKIAELALSFEGCQRALGSLGLDRSLKKEDDGFTLLKSTGCKLLCAIQMGDNHGRAKMVAFALYMNLKPEVLETRVRNLVGPHMPQKALCLELICTEANSGGAQLVLYRMLTKLHSTNTGILAHAVNQKSKQFLTRYGFKTRYGGQSVFYLSREDAEQNVDMYEGMLSHSQATRELCTRRGASPSTRQKLYWDCR